MPTSARRRPTTGSLVTSYAGPPEGSRSAEVGVDVGCCLVAVRRADPLDELRPRERVLLGPDSLDDVRGQHAADLRRTLVPESPLEPRQEPGPEGVAHAGRLHGGDA